MNPALQLAVDVIDLYFIISKPKIEPEEIERIKTLLKRLDSNEYCQDDESYQRGRKISGAVILRAQGLIENDLPEAKIMPFGSGGAHATFPKAYIGKKIKYYVIDEDNKEERP